MAKLSTVPRDSVQSVLVYGPPKVGKTELASKLAEVFKLIWIDLEKGYATLFKLPEEWQEGIELVALPDSRSYPIAIETCLKIIRGGPGWIDNETGKWITDEKLKKADKEYTFLHLNALGRDTVVVFDSLTQLTNSAIANITKNKPDDYKMEFDDWGNLGKLMDAFLSHVQQAKFNVVCISHETEVEMVDGKLKIVPTAGTRNFSRNTAKYFGHVVYCEVKNKKHQFTSSTTGSLNVITGSRTDLALENMGVASLIPIFKGEVGKPAGTGATQVKSAPATPAGQTNGQVAAGGLAEKLAALRAAKQES